MKVLFVMYAFPHPDKGFNMYTTLVDEFVKHNHDVVVLAPGDAPTHISMERGIEILRVKSIPFKNVSKYLKGLSSLFMPVRFLSALRKFYPAQRFDLIISPTPPITFAGLISKIKKRYNAKFYLILRDIFPQNAVDLNFFRKEGVYYRYFRRVEKKYYKLADKIGCMSQGNIDYVLRHNPYLAPEKLHILRNFQKLYSGSELQPQIIREKYDLGNNFIVVFGGNMGKPQQLENVLELAKRCMEHKNVRFLLLGEGVEMDKIAKNTAEENISNIIIRKSIKKDDYQDLISTCDLGLISLHRDFTIPNIPSKILDYLNVGIPVLASIDRCTDFDKVLEESGAGLFSYAGEHDAFKQNFDTIYTNKTLREEMGRAGHRYFQQYLLPEQAYNTIMEYVK